MTDEQQARAEAIKLAVDFKGDSNWTAATIFKWADVFTKYIYTGEYVPPKAAEPPK